MRWWMPGMEVPNYRYLFCSWNWNIVLFAFDKITVGEERDKIRSVGWSWSVLLLLCVGT